MSDPDPSASPLIPRSETSEESIASHTRSGENITRIWLSATFPLILHFASVLILIVVFTFYIAGHDFNLESRKALPKFTPLQSDVTTAISSAIAIYRFFAGMWTAAMLWRCVFILMENGGISLEQINTLLTWQVHLRPRRKSSQGFGLLISIILLAAFPSQLSGPILTGSITWSSSKLFTEGQSITDIPNDDMHFPALLSSVSLPRSPISPSRRQPMDPYPLFTEALNSAWTTFAPGFASTAWHGSVDDERTMKRVIRSIAQLPINSTLNNVTLPYFSVTNIEWIKDPIKDLAEERLFYNYSSGDWNPFNEYVDPGTFALSPDQGWDAVNYSTAQTGIESNTGIIAGRYGSPCPTSALFGDLPSNIGFYTPDNNSCLIYARVTYVAGAAECKDCRVTSWATVQNDSALEVLPSRSTAWALTTMAMVGAVMNLQNNSLPQAYNNLDTYVTELLIRSYAASWTAIGYMSNSSSLSTGVRVAIPTSRADVLWWRVGLWLCLNLLFTFSGILFLFTQHKSGQRLVGDPSLAALLLDTSNVPHERDRAFCDFSTLTKDDKDLGHLLLTRNMAQGGHRQVELSKNEEEF